MIENKKQANREKATNVATKKQAIKTSNTSRVIVNRAYDMVIATFNRNSKFYNEDCEALWTYYLTKSASELQTIINNQTALKNITQVEINRHCQFNGMF